MGWTRSFKDQTKAYALYYPEETAKELNESLHNTLTVNDEYFQFDSDCHFRDLDDASYNPRRVYQRAVALMLTRVLSQRDARFGKREENIVLNLGPLKGKWLPELCGILSPKKIVLVDLMRNYFDFLLKKMKKIDHRVETDFCVIDNSVLHDIETSSIDYIWTSDAITRSQVPEIRSYLKEFKRVLKEDGVGMVHLVDRESALKVRRSGWSLPRDEIVHICEELGINILAFEKPFRLGVFVILTPNKEWTL